ncbi:hypothetical protein [Lyngbya aestuarii]|uniref:hypothetical protein n=1 Tax=Lyngbya aestuarii TaxID=118322 RepID=UPI00403DB5C2
MQKWEYLTFRATITQVGYLRIIIEAEDPKLTQALQGKGGKEGLDHLGNEGWELITVLEDAGSSSLIFFFKRPQVVLPIKSDLRVN